MDRMEEYKALRDAPEELPPALEGAVARARARARRRRLWRRISAPAGSVAAVFAAFVLLVNLSTPFALACGKVPVLKELAAAVAFSVAARQAAINVERPSSRDRGPLSPSSRGLKYSRPAWVKRICSSLLSPPSSAASRRISPVPPAAVQLSGRSRLTLPCAGVSSALVCRPSQPSTYSTRYTYPTPDHTSGSRKATLVA